MNEGKSFASDNNSGVHPLIIEEIIKANEGHVIGYGDDPYTLKAISHLKNILGQNIDVYFVLTGTGANIILLFVQTLRICM